MSIRLLNKVFDDDTLKSNEKLLMLAIADNASDNDGELGTCFPSIKTLMKKCGLSNRAVINNIDKLIEKGLLKKAYRSRKKGGRSSNKYLMYPAEYFQLLSEEDAELFTQSEECSQRDSKPKVKNVHSEPKVKNVHYPSEECSQGIATQSEECSQESEPSLKDINHQLTITGSEQAQNPPQKNQNLPADSTTVFNEYVIGMKQRYGEQVTPARNAKINKLLNVMIERIGLEQAVSVARNYPLHQNNWYVQKVHAVDYMVQDCEALSIQVQSGQMVTRQYAYEQDQSGNLQNKIALAQLDPRANEVF